MFVGTRRALLGGGPRVVVSDTFAAADGTSLPTYNPLFSKHATGSTNTADPSIDAGRAHGENAASTSLYVHAYVPRTPDYIVAALVVQRTDNNLSLAGPAGRVQSGANTLYHVQYNTQSNSWQLVKRVAGTATVFADIAATLVSNQPYLAELSMFGAEIKMIVNGAVIGSATDSAITLAGSVGVRFSGAATSTTGLHLDEWLVRA